MPWTRSDGWFVKTWLVAGPFAESLEVDPLAGQGGEATLQAKANAELKRPDGTTVRWKESTSWSDAFGVDEALGLAAPDSGTAYAYAIVKRAAAGPALLSLGSDDGVRVWVNGELVHEHRGARPLVFDEDRVQAELRAGENTVLVKAEQRRGPWAFALRVLETGSVLAPMQEIGPALLDEDVRAPRRSSSARTCLARARRRGSDGRGGGPRRDDPGQRPGAPGRKLTLDASGWPDGPYEVRFTTTTASGKTGRPTCRGSRATRAPRPRPWSRRRRAST